MHADPQGEAATLSPSGPQNPSQQAPTPAGKPNGPIVAATTPPTVLGLLRRQYAEADGERSKTMLILPGRFDSNLAVRFKPIEFDETRRRAKRMMKRGGSTEAELNFAAEIIAEACDEILLRPEPGAELQSMAAVMDRAEPVRFDATLCEAIGIDVGDISEAQTVRMLFKNPEALTNFYAQLAAWLREEEADEDDEDDEERPT